ncbi:MAG: 16S rRNA (cytidine(1402)-2'-O)-methyltransferase [Nanoarchaeota archaeon]|nr:16S rRNA (cytidine(1402)-2'-O)-methyltransferase [Nanoarchaeota archaeon]
MLYIVATPIGNLKDITFRAIDVLRNVDLILAEDTRRTGILLKEYKIKGKMISFNDFNKEKKTASVIEMLKKGKEIALVSDAGTPGISDPGFYLVRECVKGGIKIIPVPGACALISGLVCSGLPTDKFSFFGFIPKKEGKKKEFFKGVSGTTVFYESPHRLLKTLKLMNEMIPNKNVVIARELTKKFEEFIRGTVAEVYLELKDKKIKGEIVVVIN